MKRKGIILAGGRSSRLFPMTKSICKQLLSIFDKPMIYYPLSILMMANIREILVISSPRDINIIKDLLGNGNQWGIKIDYEIQLEPDGIAQAPIIAEKFLNGSPSVLILGDNLFYGNGLKEKLNTACKRDFGATIFGYKVKDPNRYGVIELKKNGSIKDLVEKPKKNISNYAMTGIYFFDEMASTYAKDLVPSNRGELEITDLNKIYLKKGKLFLEKMGRGYAWIDTGTPESLLGAGVFVETIENRQGLKICCPEEISIRNGWMNKDIILNMMQNFEKTDYYRYISEIEFD